MLINNEQRGRLKETLENHCAVAECKAYGQDCTAEDCASCLADHILKDGWMRPPCKVGDYVWVVYSPKYPANPEDKGKWFISQDGVQRIIYGVKGLSIETWNMGTIPAKEIGSKLFFSEEEAMEVFNKKNDISISD